MHSVATRTLFQPSRPPRIFPFAQTKHQTTSLGFLPGRGSTFPPALPATLFPQEIFNISDDFSHAENRAKSLRMLSQSLGASAHTGDTARIRSARPRIFGPTPEPARDGGGGRTGEIYLITHDSTSAV